MTMFSEEGGWPYGEVKDTDSVLEKEKTIPAGNPVRDVSKTSYQFSWCQANDPEEQYLDCRRS